MRMIAARMTRALNRNEAAPGREHLARRFHYLGKEVGELLRALNDARHDAIARREIWK